MNTRRDTQVETHIREIAARVASATGLELVWIELLRGGGRQTVRLTIDREGGVTLDDCASFSRSVGAELEAEDTIPFAYNLEVSSPGLDRRLVRDSDYERFRGKIVRIRLRNPLNGRRNFEGVLAGLEGADILVESEGGEPFRLPVAEVEIARLVPQF